MRNADRIHNVPNACMIYYQYGINEKLNHFRYVDIDEVYIHLYYYEKLLDILSEASASDEDIKKFLSVAFDRIVRSLVKAAAYEEYFPEGLLLRLKPFLYHPFAVKCARSYTRIRTRDSRFIPLFFKLKMPYLLLLALRKRAKDYIKRTGKSKLVRLIYVGDINV
jgi:hypothetical protein